MKQIKKIGDYEKLKVGKVFKNYKELCNFLGEKPSGGDGKKIQLGKWAEQFTWTKDGHKFIINKVHINPKAGINSLTTSGMCSIGIINWLKIKIEAGEGLEIRNSDGSFSEAKVLIVDEDKMMHITGMVNEYFNKNKFCKKTLEDIWEKDFFSDSQNIIKPFIRFSILDLIERKILIADLTYEIRNEGENKNTICSLQQHLDIVAIYLQELTALNCVSLREAKVKNLTRQLYFRINSRIESELNIVWHKNIWTVTTSLKVLNSYLTMINVPDNNINLVALFSNKKNITRLLTHFTKVYDKYLISKDTFTSAMNEKDLRELPENYLKDNIQRIHSYITQ